MDYCYVQNTYFVPFHDAPVHNAFEIDDHSVDIPKNHTDREQAQIGYYQWVPFFLVLQAMLFYLPVVIWRSVYEGSGVRVQTICDTCNISGNMEKEPREKNMATIASFLTLESSVASVTGSRLRNATSGTYVTSTYLIIKVLYLLNSLLQFFLLRSFLRVDSLFWGYEVASDLINGREWPETGNFPRVTMCDYDVRVLHNLHRHTVQCVLMINMFNEKIFVAMWFWLLGMAVINFLSLAYWIVTILNPIDSKKFILGYLKKIDPTVTDLDGRSAVQQFVSENLRPDGVFLVRLVAKNTGDLVTRSLIQALWDKFNRTARRNPPPYSEPLLIGAKKLDDEDAL